MSAYARYTHNISNVYLKYKFCSEIFSKRNISESIASQASARNPNGQLQFII